jgi:DNA sulfur modification protein DndB
MSHEYSYIAVTQKNRTFLLTKLPASLLTAISYASIRGQDEEQGAVQRILNASRIASIKKFTMEKENFPASIVLNWVLKDQPLIKKDNQVSIPEVERAAQIIDGQHRVAGIKAAIQDNPALAALELPVALYEGLDTRECADIFLSINTEQKPVPRSLVFDLYGVASDTLVDVAAMRARDIAIALNESPESPYYELVKFPGAPRTKGGIALSTAVTAIKPLVEPKGTLDQIGVTALEAQKQVILNFLIALKSTYDTHWDDKSNAFLYAAGFTGAMEFFRDRLVSYCKSRKSFRSEVISEALATLSKSLIRQQEVKGLGGKDAPKVIFDRLLDAFKPADQALEELEI